MPRTIVLSFDGACRPNNAHGQAGFGFVVRTQDKALKTVCGRLRPFPGLCAQVAEWSGAFMGLRYVQSHYDCDKIVLRGDSRFVIDAIGERETPRLSQKFKRFQRRTQPLTKDVVRTDWIQSAKNKQAHNLADKAIRSGSTRDCTEAILDVVNDVDLPVTIDKYTQLSSAEKRNLRERLYRQHRHIDYSLLITCAKSRILNMAPLQWTDHHAALQTVQGERWPHWSSRVAEKLSPGRTWQTLKRQGEQFQALYNERHIGHFEDVRLKN